MPGWGAEGMGAILDTTVAAVAGATAVVGGTGAGCAGPSGRELFGAGGGMKGARVNFGQYRLVFV